ncbi:probable starch synthase 4, chloroplastic/amyloplastic isoform X2 [Solanum tuberosum]|uniref:probable starch synthase 4, chloroplastic/amyloplastic isoform X2 n=1 Tax=Solanum tuberosum TaxID=4113 RepID=UPI0003D25496|nr:PREDICTED: probable starch synthase 4, chloroplastic/amyloplastic isoform X2 [Solanum tuberosum]
MDFTSGLSFPSSLAPNGNCSSNNNCSSSFNHRSCYNNISSKANLLKKQSYVFSKYQLRNFKIRRVPRIEAQLKAEQLESSEAGCESDGLQWPSPNDEIPFWKGDFPSWDLSSDASAGVEQDSDLLHIVHVTAEMAPIAKVGGLGDVVTGLGRACLNRGHKVDVMIPFYECIPKHCINELALMKTYNSYHDGNWVACKAYRGEVSGVPVILIEPSNHFFKGKNIYGGSYNELDAYLFFSRACLEWMQVNGTQPDIIHVHEWQTGALPLFYWDMYHFLSLQKPRIVLTIHNMEHYGECRQEQLSKFGLDGSAYATEDKAVDDRTVGHNPERLSLLKGGIVYSNAIVTVSPTYLKETLCSGWLSGALMRNRDKYSGILNGIDTEMWNPATDIYLPAKFDASKTEGKRICKQFVQRGLGLPFQGIKHGICVADQIPLVVCITRLVAQKGLHLITHAIKHVEELGGQMVVLGRASDDRVEREFEGLAELRGAVPYAICCCRHDLGAFNV